LTNSRVTTRLSLAAVDTLKEVLKKCCAEVVAEGFKVDGELEPAFEDAE